LNWFSYKQFTKINKYFIKISHPVPARSPVFIYTNGWNNKANVCVIFQYHKINLPQTSCQL